MPEIWQSTAQMAIEDDSSSPLLRAASRPPPRITYSRQTNRPLSLTATQFRRDTRAIPADKGERLEHISDLPATAAPAQDEDSGTSDSEGERRSAFPANWRQSGHRAGQSRATRGSFRPLRQASSSSPRTPPEPVSRRKKRSTRKPVAGSKSASVRKTKSGTRTAAPSVRRLRVNELILVASPQSASGPQNSAESSYGIGQQDPITDMSGTSSACGSPRGSTRRPLSTLRNRLQTSKRMPRLVSDLPPPSAANWIAAIKSRDGRGRDGFERSELVITNRAARSKTPAKRSASFIQGFTALQLGSGPLPDVVFEASPMELDLEAGSDNMANVDADGDHYKVNPSPPPSSNQSQKLRDLEMERLIRAQLASISAPARAPSESSESEVDSDVETPARAPSESSESEVDSDVENNNADHEEQDDNSDSASTVETSDQNSPDAFTCPPPFQRPQRTDEDHHSFPVGTRHNRTPGQLAKQSHGKRKPVEVSDTIVQVPDSRPTPEDYPAGYKRPSDKLTPGQQSRSPLMLYPQRLRSILKSSSLATPSDMHRSGTTKANTRWNSRLEASDESPYFTSATGTSRTAEHARYGIKPRRRSSYFVDQKVHILDSDRIVPETSPSRFEYRHRGRVDLVVAR